MLCRRPVVKRALRVRYVSTREDLTAAAAAINPITGLPTPDNPDADPGAAPPAHTGPRAYSSPEQNPLTTKSLNRDLVDARQAIRPTHRFDCVASRNNTITTFSSLTYCKGPFEPPTSKVIAWFSGGSVGFKKANRAGFEAGHQCAVRVFKLIEEAKNTHPTAVRVHLYLKGFGMGREAVKTALLAAEGEKIRDTIKQVVDRTPIKIGGTRAKKTRRL